MDVCPGFYTASGWRFIGVGAPRTYAGVFFLLCPALAKRVLSFLLLSDKVAALVLRALAGPTAFVNFHAETEDYTGPD